MAHQPGPLDSPHRPGSADRDHQDPQTTSLCLGRTDHPLGTPVDPASSGSLALGWRSSAAPWPGCEPFHPGLTAPSATDPPTGQPKIPADSRQPGPREFPAAYSLAIPRIAAPADGHRGPCAAMKTVRRPPYPKWNPGYFPCSSLTPLPLSSRRPSVSFGGFGLRPTAGTTDRHRGLQGGTDVVAVSAALRASERVASVSFSLGMIVLSFVSYLSALLIPIVRTPTSSPGRQDAVPSHPSRSPSPAPPPPRSRRSE